MFVVGLAAILVLAVASTAYAAATSGYAIWTSGGANAGTAATPHKDYRTTTVKCAVCHAVHKATATGELLLGGTAGESCIYCHIEGQTGLVRIYAADEDNYLLETQYAHADFPASTTVGSRCTDCHAVHGANTIDNATVDKFILKSQASASNGPGGVETPQAEAVALAAANPADKQYQIDMFCSMCHPYAQYDYNGTILVDDGHASGDVQSGAFQSHVMTAATAAYGNPAKSIAATRVAWVGSEHCRSCHDAGETDVQFGKAITGVPFSGVIVTSSYPHFTPNQTRFLYAAASASSATEPVTYVPSGTASNNMVDGVCLKCHRGVPAASGVGMEF